MSGITATANDVVEILKAAKASRVTKLKFGDLEVEFDTNFHPNKYKSNASHKDVSSEVMGHESGSPSPENNPQDAELMMAELEDQLAIEDPLAFEEMHWKRFNNSQGATN